MVPTMVLCVKTALSMEKRKIIKDADDVLILNFQRLNDFHNHKYDKKLKPEDYTSFDLTKIWGMSVHQVYEDEREYYRSPFYEAVESASDGPKAVAHLSNNYGLVIATGRGSDVEEYLPRTIEKFYSLDHFHSIHHLGFPYGYGLRRKKWQVCKDHNSKLLVDDFQGHLIEAALQGIHGIMITQPWNKGITDLPKIVYRARNLTEAVEIIEKKEEIIWG